MDLNYFDIVAGTIILLLGLKGIINGFFKELFGLIGIIGGIFIASRLGESVGTFLNDAIFNFSSDSAVSFMGFLTTLAIFWIFMVLMGIVFKKLTSMSGLGIYDKILGFIFGASKFFLIAAVIAHAAYNIKAVRSTIDSIMHNSILFPVFVETGAFIMKIDPADINDTIKDKIEAGSDTIEEKVKEQVKDNLEDQIDEIQSNIKEVQK